MPATSTPKSLLETEPPEGGGGTAAPWQATLEPLS